MGNVQCGVRLLHKIALIAVTSTLDLLASVFVLLSNTASVCMQRMILILATTKES